MSLAAHWWWGFTHSVMSDSLWPGRLPGSSAHGISQARMFPSPRDFPDPGVESMSPTLQAVFIAPRVFTAEPSEKPVCTLSYTERSLVIYFNCKLSWVSWFCWLRWWFGFLFLINLAALPRANLDSKIIFYHLPSLYGLVPSIMLSLVSPSVNGGDASTL